MEQEVYDYIWVYWQVFFFLYYVINMLYYFLQVKLQWWEYYVDLLLFWKEYVVFISMIDESLGCLMDQLDCYGFWENIIVILQFDYGYSIEVCIFGGGGYVGFYCGCKFFLFEVGICVLVMISYFKVVFVGLVWD